MIDRRTLIGAAGALCVPGASRAGPPVDPGLYLPDILKLRAHDPKAFGEPHQMAALIGDEAAALADGASERPQLLDLDGASVTDVLDLIVQQAKGRRVVILNEAHQVSRCRAFGHAVALRLRAEGFDTFAAEDFLSMKGPNPFDALAAGGPVTFDVGYYLRDPDFAEMVRGVREAGYALAAYEQRPDQQGPKGVEGLAAVPYREHAESKNLAALLAARPGSRVLVYCGYSHAAKRRQARTPWMAARLIAMTGIDPLSIDQSTGWPLPSASPAQGSPVDQVLARLPIDAPAALRRPDGGPLMLDPKQQGAFDIQIVHPRLPDVDGRPGWLPRAPGRRRVVCPLPAGLAAGDLAQAVPAGEAAAAPSAVPADQYPVAADARQAVFFLRPGRHVLRVETPAGRRALGLFDA